MPEQVKPLSDEVLARAAAMRGPLQAEFRQGMDWRKIAVELNVSERALLLHFDPARLERKRESSRRWWKFHGGERNSERMRERMGKLEIPPEVLAERDRVLSLNIDPFREITGDPPPGRSALDQKRREARAA